MSNIIIKKATTNDIEKIAQLHIDTWCDTYSEIISKEYLEYTKNNINNIIDKMRREFNLKTIIVALLNDEIVGFSEYAFSNEFSKDLDIDCELCNLYVKAVYKNMGIGTKLFDYVVKEFKDNKKNTMGLWCVKDNIDAIRFYSKKGGIFVKEKIFTIGNEKYSGIALLFNI